MIYTVVIPTRNGAATLPELLAALAMQKTEAEVEIIAIDSGSNDATLEMLTRAGAKIERIEPETFSHSRTRNQAIALGRGEYVFLLSQDAVPGAYDYLNRLSEPLRGNPQVAGAYAKQIPRIGATPLERMRWERSPAAGREPRLVQIESVAAFDAMTPDEQRRLCEFHSAACCLRRSVWVKIPLPDVPIAEDVAWAREVLRAGHALTYEPQGFVFHSHERPLGEEYERIREEAATEWGLFSRAPVTSALQAAGRALLWGAGDAAAMLAGSGGSMAKRPVEAARAAAFAWVRSLALYEGYREGKRRNDRGGK